MKNLHPLQSPLWGKFREQTEVKVIRINNLQLTIHSIPHFSFKIGYLPKGPDITQGMLDDLKNVGIKEKCIFIQIEPDVEKGSKVYKFKNLYPAAHPLFTKYNFILDLTKSEEDLLKGMSQKTRYNVRLAQRKGVEVIEDNSDNAFNDYFKLINETTKRQKFYAHNQEYHKIMRETFKSNMFNKDSFTPHLLLAKLNGKALVAWLLFVFNDTLYYPYGASSSDERDVMASNLIMWETIRFGKKLGLKNFDMWGAANVAEPTPENPYYGFHRFKSGYGPRHVEYVGSYDFVINTWLYLIYKITDKIRWTFLKLK